MAGAVHPPPDPLAAYGLGRLSDAEADAVARHLDRCPACRARVADLPADSFLGRLRAAGRPGAETPRPAASAPNAPAPGGFPDELAATGQYADVRELGRGGMGVVYLARN